ncbi:MAG: hypothetical protein WCO54_10695 [Bacteroidota bacterium]
MYISNTNDTIAFYGQGVNKYFETHAQSNSQTCEASLDNGQFENISYVFTGNNPISNLRLEFHLYYNFDDNVLFSSVHPDGLYDYLNININWTDMLYKNCLYANSSSNYSYQININGKNYSGTALSNGTVYNYHYGVLQFKFNGKTWTLNK